jgi:hypothetical protein
MKTFFKNGKTSTGGATLHWADAREGRTELSNHVYATVPDRTHGYGHARVYSKTDVLRSLAFGSRRLMYDAIFALFRGALNLYRILGSVVPHSCPV